MSPHAAPTVLFVIVALGVALQLLAVSRFGLRIVRDRLAGYWHSVRSSTTRRRTALLPVALRAHHPITRHRRRDYRSALRSGQHPSGN